MFAFKITKMNEEASKKMIMKRKIAYIVLLSAIFAVMASTVSAEVRLFVDKNTVRVWDPELNSHSILNEFQPVGWKTHNYLALVWSVSDTNIYDIRTHMWMPLTGFITLNGTMSDNYAMVWNQSQLAVFDARERRWIVSDNIANPVVSPLISRGMSAAVTKTEFIVYDPILRQWMFNRDFTPKDAVIGDNLAVAWDDRDAYVYDTTLHQWLVRQNIAPQAAIVEDYAITIYSVDKIHTYNAMKHRWDEQSR